MRFSLKEKVRKNVLFTLSAIEENLLFSVCNNRILVFDVNLNNLTVDDS